MTAHTLWLDSGISLVIGLALLMAWHAERAQRFSLWLGGSFVAQAIAAPAWLLLQSMGNAPWRGLCTAVLLGAASAGVAGWLIGVVQLARAPARLPARVFAALVLAAGLLLALAPGQAPATLLRVALGLVLLHAAASRRRGEAERLRDQLLRLVDRSHQGMAVMQGEAMKYANPALLRMYGLPPEASAANAAGSHWRDRTIAESDRATARERHRRIIAGEIAEDHWQGERTAFDGRRLHLRFSAWKVDWDGEPAEQVVVTDDTARRDAMQTLLQRATNDELTGLPNRSALQQRLHELCAVEPPQPFALLLLDVDRFKLFNEAHGPTVGDDVLRALAQGLVQSVANGKGGPVEVMRLGEDEFALLVPATDAERAANELAQGVRQLLGQPFELPAHRFFLDVSMGIALHPQTAATPEALLRSANAAMHQAKQTPGTSLQFAEERFERGSGATLEAEQALRAGMKNDEFKLVYQPKVDAATSALVGFEALVRWDRPGLGRIDPHEFIPAAERTGLIGPLGNLILTLACHQIADWRETFGAMVPVAVNVSPLQLLDPGFPELVVRTLRHFNIPAELLTLEITESAAVTHMEQAREQIGQMRAHGIEVALDDFGTGFSSLNMLRSLPLSTVKIDRTLIDPMPASDAMAVVKAICDLAAALGLQVVAEGVETQVHASAALDAGCQVLQGYFYARPLDPAEAARWMRGRPEFKR